MSKQRQRRSGRRFIQLWSNVKRSTASYHGLSLGGRSALLELLDKYSGANNGMIAMSLPRARRSAPMFAKEDPRLFSTRARRRQASAPYEARNVARQAGDGMALNFLPLRQDRRATDQPMARGRDPRAGDGGPRADDPCRATKAIP